MPETTNRDITMMSHALTIAQRGWGQTNPNPMVGAVIVEEGILVAEGWHRAAGQAHAEIEAFRALGRKPNPGATLYVTLEPCSTKGRTGACTAAIIESGISEVVIGAIDPNPDHSGGGLVCLREAGITVRQGILEEACEDLNLLFNHWMKEQTPLLAGKIATTFDGKFTTAEADSRWITGEASRADVMRWRRYFPAIAVSAKTALTDNPSLTSRLPESTWCPRRFIFDRNLETSSQFDTLRVFNDSDQNRSTLICGEKVDASPAQAAGINLWQLPEKDGHLDLDTFRVRCAEEGIHGVYIEPGPRWAYALIAEQSIDYLFHYTAPKDPADTSAKDISAKENPKLINEAYALSGIRNESFAQDTFVRGWLRPNKDSF